jgi:mono/diheme cytochrome c family protein
MTYARESTLRLLGAALDGGGVMQGRTILVAVGIAAIAATTSLSAQDAKLVEKGEKLYVANKCSVCHSVAGKGNKKGPLDEVGSKLTADEIRQWMLHPVEMTAKAKSTRKPPMKSYDKLPKEDIEALVAYMQSLKKK